METPRTPSRDPLRLAAALLAAVATLAACHRAPSPGPGLAPAGPPAVRASCLFTAEATYDAVELAGGVVHVTSFVDAEGRCAQWVASIPCWRPEDLRAHEVRPSPEALAAFAREVESSGFLDLPPVTGGDPGEMGRYYAYTLSVDLGSRSNAVTHRSFPDGEPIPPAFDRVWKALHALAGAPGAR